MALALLPFGFVAAGILKPGNPVLRSAAVMSGPVKMRQAGLAAVIQGKQGAAQESDEGGPFSSAQDVRSGLSWPCFVVSI